MRRGLLSGFELVTVPNPFEFPETKAVPGNPNCSRLNKLKNSVRNCRLVRSVIPVVLKMAKSKLLIPSARSVASTRDSSPNPQAGGPAKQAVLGVGQVQDFNNLNGERSISSQDVPQRHLTPDSHTAA